MEVEPFVGAAAQCAVVEVEAINADNAAVRHVVSEIIADLL